ncbi:FecR family protein [Chitinophaga ginsengisegetis]|uniref:FecR family protein n=1 Tax=Chitinophaga ginsengisegetis TaxID=393003 RepID=A0A1T5P4H5_9BACT|nr:FecR domain-containing protein [Chitinophaga ginsengisegetis]SKD07660.1 FecR family protein [Chitinophaga ginsengisegetis]
MSRQINRELIEKFLAGKCSAEEERLVNLFLKDPASEKLLEDILSANAGKDWIVFENDKSVHPRQQELKKSMQERIGHVNIARRRSLLHLRHAAIWIGLILTAMGIYTISYLSNKRGTQVAFVESNNPNGQRSKIILSDSSVVYLGAGSRLKYPENFSGDTRDIYLYGEAFFEVTKEKHKPFTVHTGDVQTKVLGTSFKIEAFKNKPLLVEVATGKVKVDQVGTDFSRSLAVLTPGQKVLFDHGEIKRETVDPEEVQDLKEARLTFNNASLNDIAEVLQRWYNVKITFKQHTKSAEKMTLTLDARVPIDKILNVLAAAGHFSYEMKNGEIVIR